MTSSLEELVTSNKRLEIRNYLTSNKLTSLEIQERALGLAEGLTSTEDPNDMTAWYCKAYRTIGEGKYTMCVSMARKTSVTKPKSLFGWLLKQEMKAKTS